MTIVVVTGGRDYDDLRRVAEIMYRIAVTFEMTLVVHGNCPTGLDKMVKDWCIRNHVPERGFDAMWSDIHAVGAVVRRRSNGQFYNAKAGPDRNERMIRETDPDIGLAFPGGAGTSDAYRRMRKFGYGKPTFKLAIIRPVGPLQFQQ